MSRQNIRIAFFRLLDPLEKKGTRNRISTYHDKNPRQQEETAKICISFRQEGIQIQVELHIQRMGSGSWLDPFLTNKKDRKSDGANCQSSQS